MSPQTQALWTLAEVAAAVEGAAFGVAEASIRGVSIDTRSLQPGDLFVALKGPNFDGNGFVGAAASAGAAAALVEARPGAGHPLPTVSVADTQAGLERLGRAARARTDARIIAVTGSVGKTSTKEMLAAALSSIGETHWSGGSLNNHWGVPLSLSRMPRDTRFGVFELGMNHAGEIAGLTTQVRPHVAVITTVEAVHLEFFPSVEAIADAKAEIFLGLERDGVAIINGDNPHAGRLAAAARAAGAARIIRFGSGGDAHARLINVTTDGAGSIVEASLFGQTLRYRLGLAGHHMALNSLSVLAAVKAAGADPAAASVALGDLSGLAGRGKRVAIPVVGGQALLIDESYNASPASVRAALSVLAATPVGAAGRRIAVLGEMRELGSESPALHRGLAETVAATGIDQVFTVGPLMRNLADALPPARLGGWSETAAAMAPEVAAVLKPGDVVMVKGSFGIRMADIVKPLIAGLAAGGVSC
jgi:UDP-N-acetylmuramoyl-tripeptide--D-alanyl-D-alanine ligase